MTSDDAQLPSVIAPTEARGLVGNVFLILPLLIVLVVGAVFGHHCLVRERTNESLQVRARDLEVGTVWFQEEFQHTLPIRNTSVTRDVTIIGFRTAGCCLSVEPRSLVVPAGATVDIRVTLGLTPATSKEAALPSRSFSGRLAPVIRGGLAYYAGWAVQGKVRSLLVLKPREVWFGGANRPVLSASRSESLVITAHQAVDELEVRHGPCVESAVIKQDPGDSRRFQMEVLAGRSLTEGPFECRTWIAPKLPSGEWPPAVPLPVRGTVDPEFAAIPAIVDHGGVPHGESRERVVVLESRLGRSFRVAGVTVWSDEEVSVQPQTTSFATRHEFRVARLFRRDRNDRFSGDSMGGGGREVGFSIETPEGDSTTVTVGVRGYCMTGSEAAVARGG